MFNQEEQGQIQRASRALLAREDFLAYCQFIDPSYRTGPMIVRLASTLQLVESGKINKLIVIGPPQHGKSKTTSGLFPSWCAGRGKNRPILLTSYGADPSERWSIMNRDTIASNPNYRLVFPDVYPDPDRQSKEQWSVQGEELSMLAAGIHGVATGFPAWGIIIDDPIKNYKEAQSPTVREDIYNTYLTVSKTRLMEHGWIIIIAARWNEDDLIGRVIASDEGSQFHVLHLPALSLGRPEDYADLTEGERRKTFKSFPKAAFPDPLNRPKGDPLWPEQKSLSFLLAMRRVLKHFFSSLYQGIPSAPEGNRFLRTWFKSITRTQLNEMGVQAIARARSWDLAWSERTSADFTVGLKATMYRVEEPTPGKEPVIKAPLPTFVVLEDVARWKAEWSKSGPDIVSRAVLDGRACHLLVEAVASQNQGFKSLRKDLRLKLHTIIPITPTQDKEARGNFTELFAAMGGLFILYEDEDTPPIWEGVFVDEIVDFPHASNDDQYDALTQLINHWEAQLSDMMNHIASFVWDTGLMNVTSVDTIRKFQHPAFTEAEPVGVVDRLGWAG